jgi:hypothetical protein
LLTYPNQIFFTLRKSENVSGTTHSIGHVIF